MSSTDNRLTLRKQFYDAYTKSVKALPLSPLDSIIVDIIQVHPEYIPYLSQEARFLDKDFLPEAEETNPFLHMSGHISIREQIQSNRPKGITQLYQKLLKTHRGDAHRVEHALMDVMMEILWTAQRQNQAPDEQQYLKKCRKLLK